MKGRNRTLWFCKSRSRRAILVEVTNEKYLNQQHRVIGVLCLTCWNIFFQTMFLRYFTRTFAKKRIGCSARFIRGCSSEIATHNLDPSSVQAQMEAREGKAVTNLPFAKDLFLGKFDPVRNPYQASNVVLGLICRSACKPILQEFVWCVFCDLLFIPSRTC